MKVDDIIIIAQIIGIAAMMMNVFSLQCRSNQNFFRCQTAGGVLFTISFIMLGAWSGAMMNVYGILRPELLRREKIAASKWVLPALLALLICFSVALLFFPDEKWYLVLTVFTAQTAGTCFMWSQNGKLIRLGQLFLVSPLWLTYNFLLPVPSIGGVIAEMINILSVLIALFRYRKIGFTKN